MVRAIVAICSLVFVVPVLADVNTNVQNCLTSNSSSAAGSKTSCVQAAINAEETTQIQAMFAVYSNFVNNEINSGTFGSIQGGTSGGGSTQGSATATPSLFGRALRPSSPPSAAPTSPAPAASQATTPLPTAQAPKPSPKQSGGIQYY